MTTEQSAYFALTARELRSILFDLDDQQMTVADLRGLLFNLDNQGVSALSAVEQINREERARKAAPAVEVTDRAEWGK